MADKSKEDKKEDMGAEDEDGLWLWRYVTRNVRPLLRGRGEDVPPAPVPPRGKKGMMPHEAPPQERQQGKPSMVQQEVMQHPGLGLDRRSDEKLRRGKMAIEGRLDLHGHGRDRAYELLRAFIEDSYAREKRCVLVITGKGRGGAPGILREAVPGWLSTAPLGALVLRFYPAQPRDGGTGALYVLLRRQRD